MRREETTQQSPLMIETEEMNGFAKKIVERLHGLGTIRQEENFIPNDLALEKVEDKQNLTTVLEQRLLLASLARIILPSNDHCACIKIEKKKILWSCNLSLTDQSYGEVMEVVNSLGQLAEAREETRARELRRKLLEKAILKDADYCRKEKVRETYDSHLKGDYARSWKNFESSLFHLKNTTEENKKLVQSEQTSSRRESSREDRDTYKLLKNALENRCELIKDLLTIREERRITRKELPYRLFKALFNVTDLLVILREIAHKSAWWKKIAVALQEETKQSRNGFQIVKGELTMHAEMKMLEGKTDYVENTGNIRKRMRNFISEISKPSLSSQFAVTKRLCLACELALVACEKVTSKFGGQEKRSKVTAANPTSKVLFHKWISFHLYDETLRKRINNLFSKLLSDLIEKIQQPNLEEGVWIEQQLVGVNLENERENLEILFFEP